VFSSDGRFGYSLAEMSGVLTAYGWDAAEGALREIQQVTMKTPEFDKNATMVDLNSYHSAEVALHPNNRYLYASNRGPDTIAVFAVDPGNGTLKPVEEVSSRGVMPRQFTIDPTGKYLLAANQASDDIAILAIDRATGRLAPTRKVVKVNSPSCVTFVPAP
jgi:6-phosphogluconolactonase